jgi:pyruvate dehydrogenase E2 component (dihydrolipoamide acetyltransferase)
VVRWLAAVGEEVGIDQPIVELETDKAVVEIPAPQAGVILHQGAPEGATILVEELLVVIGEAGEEWVPGASGGGSTPITAAVTKAADAAPIVGTLEEAVEVEQPVGIYPDHRPGLRSSAGTGGELDLEPGEPITPALPMIRRLSASLGVDLSTVRGTGPAGRVTREDVEAAARRSGDAERVRMSPTRLAISRNLARSWQEIPHVTTYGEADAGPILAARRALSDEVGRAVPLEALLISRIVPLLKGHREFNAAVDGEDVLYRSVFDIGVAVDTPSGLMVVVVRGAEALSEVEIGDEVIRLSAAARDRSIGVADLRGATFTLSNIGAVGGRYGTPIIPYGTSAILSVGRADERPVVRRGEIAVGREFPLSLSYDHRIIDGAAGRAFMGATIEAIERA